MRHLARWIVLALLIWAALLVSVAFDAPWGWALLSSTAHLASTTAAASVVWLAGMLIHWFPTRRDPRFGAVMTGFAFMLAVIGGSLAYHLPFHQLWFDPDKVSYSIGDLLHLWLPHLVEGVWLPIVGALSVTVELQRVNAKDPSDAVRWHAAPPPGR